MARIGVSLLSKIIHSNINTGREYIRLDSFWLHKKLTYRFSLWISMINICKFVLNEKQVLSGFDRPTWSTMRCWMRSAISESAGPNFFSMSKKKGFSIPEQCLIRFESNFFQSYSFSLLINIISLYCMIWVNRTFVLIWQLLKAEK